MIAEWVIVNCLKDVLTPGDYIVCNYNESPEEVYHRTAIMKEFKEKAKAHGDVPVPID